jgi:ferric-chelate reductase (NADPH)
MRTAEWLADVAGAVMATPAEVTAVDRSIPDFVRVGLRAPSFRRVSWTPGSKLQVRPTPGKMTMRTYTPARWDADAGETELVGFTHGEGPAAAWFTHIEMGGTLQVYRPRKSIDLTAADSVLFVGDESSVALARALTHVACVAQHVFEATEPTSLTAILAELGLQESVTVVRKTEDRATLLDAARRDSERLGQPYDLVASGDAATVHAVHRNVRGWSRQPRRKTGKAYWAAGRTGLD